MAEFPVVQVWCPLHQIDLVVKETTDAIDDGAWLSMTYELTVYLRRQDNLITEMGVTSPKKTNRWVALASVLHYNMKHEPKIVSYISQRHEERNVVVPPVLTKSWCTRVYVVAPGIERIKQTFAELQHRLLLVSQQRVYIENLLIDMVILYNLRLIEDAEFDDLSASSNIRFGDWYILKQTMIDFILDQGSRAKAHIDKLDHKSDFNESWDQLSNVRFVNLRRLCAGFATAWPNSASVESDFSVLKWEKDAFCTALLALSLEGIFQSKQFEMLASL
jgi:hypothetical protein